MRKKILLLFFAFSCLVNAQDKPPIEKQHPTEKQPVVNVYVDNTGSMFGYISKGNEFEWALSNMLTSINLSGLTDESNIHLAYINSEIFPYEGSISKFLSELKYHNAQNYRGDLGITCMSNFFSKALAETGSDTISIIISDFIISPGRGNDASTVLASEKNAISNIFKNQINKYPDLAVCLYRLESNFNGPFYDCLDNSRTINAIRPYYMIVVSSRSYISRFTKKVSLQSIDNGHGQSAVTNKHIFFNADVKTPKHVVISTTKGTIVTGAHGIKGASLGADNKYRFIVAVDLSQYSLLGNYLTDKSNYILNDKRYQITRIQKSKGAGTTHRITIETNQSPTPGAVTITLKNTSPEWISKYNIDANDCDIIFENLDKTFGIKTITDAIFNAFSYQKKELFSISISINS